jgi:hypothetical protein
MGPLLWHWADGAWDELSMELSLADVQQAALLMGFKLTSQEFVDAAYIGECRLLLPCCANMLCAAYMSGRSLALDRLQKTSWRLQQ